MRSARLALSLASCCRGRKATEVIEPSAPAAKAVDGDVAPQSATPWRNVLMGNIPDDRHIIQALIARVEQLEKLIQNNQAQSHVQHDNCRQHRMERAPQTEHIFRYSKRQNLVVFGTAENSACASPEALTTTCKVCCSRIYPAQQRALVSCANRLGKWKVAQKKPRAVLVELTTVSAKHRAFKASSRLRADSIRLMRISTRSRCNSARACPQASWASRSEASSLSSGATL